MGACLLCSFSPPNSSPSSPPPPDIFPVHFPIISYMSSSAAMTLLLKRIHAQLPDSFLFLSLFYWFCYNWIHLLHLTDGRMGRLFFKWLLSSLKGWCITELSMRVLVLSRNFQRTCSVSFHYRSAICWLLLTNLIMVGQIVCEIYSVPFPLFLQIAICASHVLRSEPTTVTELPKTQLKQESPIFLIFPLASQPTSSASL